MMSCYSSLNGLIVYRKHKYVVFLSLLDTEMVNVIEILDDKDLFTT